MITTTRGPSRPRWAVVVFLALAAGVLPLRTGGIALGRPAAETIAIRQASIAGAWRTDEYVLKDGPTHRVDGMIFFTTSDWTVLFFIVDAEGNPQRGSAEGGTYTLEGDRLTFAHLYNASGGGAVEGLAASEWSMQIRDADEATSEPCRIDRNGDRLTIHFPSGNRMTFRRSSDPERRR